jgi:hypothetical protein
MGGALGAVEALDPSGRHRSLGHDQHGGHHGRHHALTPYRRSLHAGAHQ